MNIIIVEGLDNTGKSTVINSLVDKYSQDKRIAIVHCEKPKGNTNEEMAEYQNQFFANLAKTLIGYKKDNKYDIVILDRAWYGEYVYGQLYREHEPFDIEMNISMIENSLKFHFKEDELSFILLNVSDVDFSIAHDDGLSISNAKKEKITIEKEMFETIFKFSTIKNKANIFVNSGSSFRPKDAILYEVCKVIKIS